MPIPRWRRSAPTAESRAAPFAQSRASRCRGPHDRFPLPAASHRAIALATLRSSRSRCARAAARNRVRPGGIVAAVSGGRVLRQEGGRPGTPANRPAGYPRNHGSRTLPGRRARSCSSPEPRPPLVALLLLEPRSAAPPPPPPGQLPLIENRHFCSVAKPTPIATAEMRVRRGKAGQFGVPLGPLEAAGRASLIALACMTCSTRSRTTSGRGASRTAKSRGSRPALPLSRYFKPRRPGTSYARKPSTRRSAC